MITIKSSREVELLRKAGEIVGKTHKYIKKFIKPGVTTKKLEELANNFILSHDATPSFKGFEGYPAAICTSVNEEVVHGIPSAYKLRNGDIIGIDIGACYKGYHGDSAWTYPVGTISKEKEHLLRHTEESLFKGLEVVKAGMRIGDIGNAISTHAAKYNLRVIRELVGHGVGNSIHEEPDVPNYGRANTGIKLEAGMVIAIEPMLNLGSREIEMLDDNWTIVTKDNSPSAHFEHTVLVTEDGYEILTKR